jgi:hypothetical protein
MSVYNEQTSAHLIDIKDPYVNLSVHNIINITKFWLDKYNNQNIIIKQTLELIKVVVNQNYFQNNDKYFKPTQGVAIGSHLSSNLTEIYLEYFGELK